MARGLAKLADRVHTESTNFQRVLIAAPARSQRLAPARPETGRETHDVVALAALDRMTPL